MLLLAPLAFAAPNATIPLQGGGDSLVMDAIAIDHAHQVVWVPAGGTGTVQALDLATRTFKVADGFGTGTVTRNGLTRAIGPSSVTVGEGTVYVGDRADNTVCPVDVRTYIRGTCVKLDQAPDLVAYVASTHEVWVTTPASSSIVILDVTANPKVVGTIAVPGRPEGLAVNDVAGVVYTNLEDKDQTLAIDLHKRAVTATWAAKCGDGGPKGLLADPDHPFVLVACEDHLQVIDPAKKGKILSTVDTGSGLDLFDYAPTQKWFYAAAGRAAQLTIVKVDAKGALSVVTTIPTASGARNAVVAADGAAVLTNAPLGGVLYVPAPDLSVPQPSGAP